MDDKNSSFESIRQNMTPDRLPAMCGLNDTEFARLIGLRHSQQWNAIKRGRAPLTEARKAFFDSLIWLHYNGFLDAFVAWKLKEREKNIDK